VFRPSIKTVHAAGTIAPTQVSRRHRMMVIPLLRAVLTI
jgi:hypothetical protein